MFITLFFSAREASADIYQFVSDDGTVFFTNTPVNSKGDVVVKENVISQRQVYEQRANKVVGKEDYNVIAERKAGQYNLDPRLVKAVIKTESNWNAGAVSRKGALGLMQLMPATAFEMGVSNPFDPTENIEGGVKYLKYLIEKFDGNLTLALAAYNAGPKVVEKIRAVPSFPETVAYVKKVKQHYSGGATRQYFPETRETTVAKAVPTVEKKEVEKIQKLVLNDGTVLFTNSQLAKANLENN